MIWSNWHVLKAYPDSNPVTINLTADEGQSNFQIGSRVDFRTLVTCTAATTCGVVTLTVDLGPNLYFDSYSMITADRTGQTTKAAVAALPGQRQITFIIGTDAVGLGAGEYLTLPISGRGASIPADSMLDIKATAKASGRTTVAELAVSTAAGPGPTGASKVSVGGSVWWDVDRDGIRSAADTTQDGVTVGLASAAGVSIATTKTDASGDYSFADLDGATVYRLSFTAPRGAQFAAKSAKTSGSVTSTDGQVSITTPASGKNLTTVGHTDLVGMDAGLVSYNLVLTQRLLGAAKVSPGDELRYQLRVANPGKSAALAHWQVSVVLPKQLALVSLTGEGLTCTASTCIADDALAAGASVAVTLTARVAEGATGGLWAVAYVRPVATDVAEALPLEAAPVASTKTEATASDNDARTLVEVKAASAALASTGVNGVGTELALGALLVAVGGGLLLARRSRAAN
jgi:uncharacterized repeat protein (TIGR01451 family)